LFNYMCFFFQAEDGIRDLIVTGVQTCALPILTNHLSTMLRVAGTGSMSDRDLDTFKSSLPNMMQTPGGRLKAAAFLQNLSDRVRSEERRVGKECRSRLSRAQ